MPTKQTTERTTSFENAETAVKQELTVDERAANTDQVVTDYLSKNPALAAALVTFNVAQEEYRKSLLAMTSVRIVTSGTSTLDV